MATSIHTVLPQGDAGMITSFQSFRRKKEVSMRRRRKREGWPPPFSLFFLQGLEGWPRPFFVFFFKKQGDGHLHFLILVYGVGRWPPSPSVEIRRKRKRNGHLHSDFSSLGDRRDGHIHSSFSSSSDGKMATSMSASLSQELPFVA